MDIKKEEKRFMIMELKENTIRNISQSKRLIDELEAHSGMLKAMTEHNPKLAALMRKTATEGISEFILSRERYSHNDRLVIRLLLDEGKINKALNMTVKVLRKYITDVCEVELAEITRVEKYL